MFRNSLLVSLIALLAACGSDTTTPPDTSQYAGTYQLTAVDGVLIPTRGVVAGSEVLTADGHHTWSQTQTVSGQTSTVQLKGLYRVEGETIIFYGQYTMSGTGTISGATLTVPGRDFTATYQKQ